MTTATTDAELREIFRRQAIKRRIHSIEAEDIAQEMFCLALANERARGISRFKQTTRWLFATAAANVFFRPDTRKKSGHVDLLFGYHEYYGAPDHGYPIFSQEGFEEWLCANWAPTSNRDGARFMRKYRCTANGKEVYFSGQDLKELLGKQHLNVSDSLFASNLKKRGKRMFLIDGSLWRELGDACAHFQCTLPTLHKRHEIEEVKIWVM